MATEEAIRRGFQTAGEPAYRGHMNRAARTVACQAPVTYKWWWQTPRFVPLAEDRGDNYRPTLRQRVRGPAASHGVWLDED